MDFNNNNIPPTKTQLPTRGISNSTNTWVKEMSFRDTNLWGMSDQQWVIDNKIYDLTQFAEIHPGGKSWIKLTKGQDITVLFKISHLQEQMTKKILEKYYIKQVPKKQQNRFDFDESGHYQEIRRRILDKIPLKQLLNSKKTQIKSFLIIILWLFLLALSGYFHSYILSIICGCLLISFYGIGHLFIHRKDTNILRHVYLLIGFSAQQQQIIHAISHHPYPNTLLDYQFAGIQPLVYFCRCHKKSSWFLLLVGQISVLFAGFGNAINKLIILPLLKGQSVSFQHSVIFLQIFYIYIFTQDLYISLKLWLLMLLTFGFLTSQLLFCSHRQNELWSEGAPEIRDFVLHTVSTTTDFETWTTNAFESIIIYSSFNMHVIHHLFPSIDHCKLPACNQILKQYLSQKGIRFSVNENILECNRKMWDLLFNPRKFNINYFFSSKKDKID